MRRTLCALFLIAAVGTLSRPASAAVDAPVLVSPDAQAAAAYCRQTGGHVESRVPEYGTNGSQQLVLNGRRAFCRYDHKGTHIHLFLETLYSTNPTLAALAYYSQTTPGTCNGNPASCYCSLLGGTDLFGGINAAGGAWVSKGTIDTDLDTCIFPDLSTIDSFGLFYHSAGIVRGIDLSTVLRYADPFAKTRKPSVH
jgi:putative hemolysin